MSTKKKAVNSKAKGNGFELAIAKKLSNGLAPLKFKRSQSSGAIVGGQNAKFIENYSKEILRIFVGDVVPTNEGDQSENVPLFRFSVECKFYRDVENLKHLMNKKAKIYGWMNEARVDAVKLDIEPILIFKFNNTQIFACLESDTELPDGIDTIGLPNNCLLCDFEELLLHREFWLR